MSLYVPRDYSESCITSVFSELEKTWATLAILATGTGKTRIFLEIARRWMEQNPTLRCLVLAHREELITQPAKHWRADNEEWPAIEMAELRSEINEDCDLFDSAPLNDRIVIASIPTLNTGRRCLQCTADCLACERTGKILVDCDCEDGCEDCNGTKKIKKKCRQCKGDKWVCTVQDCAICFEHFTRRMQKFRPEDFGLVIIDEAHHSVADTYTRIIRYFRQNANPLKILGVTATADRADEEEMGQVYSSVAFEYSLPQPILDGWLVPIEQQFITIEELNLANIRTIGGDLNKGDLEAEMMAERVLHKITTPTIEIACGMESGVIDRLIATGRIHELPNFVAKQEPTLIHAVDVAHAQRIAEIINRYLPDSALCIVGDTPKIVRRDGLKRFAEGGYQFLISCGVFLEGTDLPNVSIVVMARPTKSRSLYAQMLGRGLRVIMGILIDALNAEERRKQIAASSKPRCLVLDFVGNSGRHKLISSVDILGDALPEELVNGVIRKAAKGAQPTDVLAALIAAQEEEEAIRRQAKRDAAARQQKQEESERRAVERRAGIMAGADYHTKTVDPFDILDVAPKREPGYHKGRKPTEAMKEMLQKNKIPFTEETTFWEAHLLIDEIVRRRKAGLCTFNQAKWLTEHGYSADTGFNECQEIMNAWKANGWHRPRKQLKPGMTAEEVMDVAMDHGLTLKLRADGSPAIGGGKVESELLAALKQHKERIVALLTEKP